MLITIKNITSLTLPKKDIMQLKGETSMNQFIVNAIAEKLSALKTQQYLQERANRGSREHGLSILDKVPDIQPYENDIY
jgi:hypothetical protein